jgi:hypothetical protein
MTLASLALTLLAISAQASPTALLQYTSRSGSINPMYGTRNTCVLMSDGTVQTRQIVGDIATGGTQKMKFKGIPNVTVLKSLVAEASIGMVVDRKGPIPIGAGTQSFVGYKGNDQFGLRTEIGSVMTQVNTSPVTGRLVDFIRVNCAAAGASKTR